MSFEKLLRIPLDRVGVLIGKKGETKTRVEQSCGVTIAVDGQSGEVTVRSTSCPRTAARRHSPSPAT